MKKTILVLLLAALFVFTSAAQANVIATREKNINNKNVQPKFTVLGDRPGIKDFYIKGAPVYYLFGIKLDIFKQRADFKEVNIDDEVEYKIKGTFGTTIEAGIATEIVINIYETQPDGTVEKLDKAIFNKEDYNSHAFSYSINRTYDKKGEYKLEAICELDYKYRENQNVTTGPVSAYVNISAPESNNKIINRVKPLIQFFYNLRPIRTLLKI